MTGTDGQIQLSLLYVQISFKHLSHPEPKPIKSSHNSKVQTVFEVKFNLKYLQFFLFLLKTSNL